MVRAFLLCAVGVVNAHMQLFNPAPLRAANNPHTIGTPDDELLFPYNCCGKVTPIPCRGYLSLLGTPEGAPVVSWMTGSNQTWSLIGPCKMLSSWHSFSYSNSSSPIWWQSLRWKLSDWLFNRWRKHFP